jgi:hypothetical protein
MSQALVAVYLTEDEAWFLYECMSRGDRGPLEERFGPNWRKIHGGCIRKLERAFLAYRSVPGGDPSPAGPGTDEEV